MKEVKLTKGYVALVDDCDFDRINQFKWQVLIGRNIYAKRTALKNGRRISVFMHREVLQHYDTSLIVDHKDRNGLNNCRDNLRICTRSDNAKNKKPQGKSRYIGVSWSEYHKSWTAQIFNGQKKEFLGRYKTEAQAAFTYDVAAKKYHGEFANLNNVNL